MIQVLVVDDNPNIRELLSFHLQQNGFSVLKAGDGLEALQTLEKEQVHLAVIDIMMPNKDGYELCRDIRSYYDIPILILTAKAQLIYKEKGFLYGTDDYMVKPFEPKELIFRLKALLRRFNKINLDCIQLNQTLINRRSYEIHSDGKTMILPLKEFELLAQLASFPNRVFTRGDLIQLIWGVDFDGDMRTVDVHIKRLRERFSNRKNDFIIKTVRGIGYKLEVM
ncbi:response regulator transcription factor [Gottfriedia sp. NPDC057991]|uniref:response regulator transcription factor n=1 Tax=Gottfriedia sp. NPDC057991 TaxID=3346298 RepID=UPI0036D7D09A